jgi:hypothetical protein
VHFASKLQGGRIGVDYSRGSVGEGRANSRNAVSPCGLPEIRMLQDDKVLAVD